MLEEQLQWQLYGDEIRFFVFFFVWALVPYIIVTICATEVLFMLQILLIYSHMIAVVAGFFFHLE